MPVQKARKTWERALRELCPVDGVVKVVWTTDPPVADEECNGWCQQVDLKCGTTQYNIQLWKGLAERASQAEILVHEWAHALSWDQDPQGQDHGYRWGLAYRRCYQAVIAL